MAALGPLLAHPQNFPLCNYVYVEVKFPDTTGGCSEGLICSPGSGDEKLAQEPEAGRLSKSGTFRNTE